MPMDPSHCPLFVIAGHDKKGGRISTFASTPEEVQP